MDPNNDQTTQTTALSLAAPNALDRGEEVEGCPECDRRERELTQLRRELEETKAKLDELSQIQIDLDKAVSLLKAVRNRPRPSFQELFLTFLEELRTFLTEKQAVVSAALATEDNPDRQGKLADEETLAMELLDRLTVVDFLKNAPPTLLKGQYDKWWQALLEPPTT